MCLHYLLAILIDLKSLCNDVMPNCLVDFDYTYLNGFQLDDSYNLGICLLQNHNICMDKHRDQHVCLF